MFTGLFGGELGIRTLEAFRLTAFRVLHLRPLGQLSIYQSENPSQNFWKELTERTTKYSVFRTAWPRMITGFSVDKTDTDFKNFECCPLWPLQYVSICSIYFKMIVVSAHAAKSKQNHYQSLLDQNKKHRETGQRVRFLSTKAKIL